MTTLRSRSAACRLPKVEVASQADNDARPELAAVRAYVARQ
jgi:hypothetical protein